ncbi:MAG: ABC transporter substrate-binding protein [Betaproteobacteria bacterium]|nr:ABC transporter substrate-binding protein [Betaproteobacteria bacterium]
MPALLRHVVAALLACGALLAHAAGEEVLVGQSVSLTGPVAEHGQGVAQGAKLYIDAVNAAGGVGGRRIVLSVLDDAGDARRSGENAKQLIERDGVVALFAGVEGGPCVAQLKEAVAHSVPLVACVAGSPEMREPFTRMSFPVRSPHFGEFAKLLDIAKSYGMKRVAFFHADSDTGRRHLANVRKLAEARGLDVVPLVAASGAKPDDLARALAEARVDTAFNHGSYAAYAALIKAARARGSTVQFMAVNSGAAQMARLLGADAKGLIFTQVVPFPWAVAVPVVKEYHQALARSAPGAQPSFSGLEGYVSAKVLVAGLRAAGKDASRAGIAKGLESLGTLDVGGMTVAFAPNSRTGSTFVDTVIVAADGRFSR